MLRRSMLQGAAVVPFAAPHLASAQARPLRYVPQSDLTVLDPLGTLNLVTRTHALMVWDTLFGLDANFRPQLQMLESATQEDGGKVWRLTLREGLRFHDNEPVRGRDAVASLRRWAQMDAYGRTLMALTDELTAPDDRTILFKLKVPFPHLPAALAKITVLAPVIMPERMADTPANRLTEYVGSGPFRFRADDFVVGSRAIYEKFAGYVPRNEAPSLTAGGKHVTVDRVEWLSMPDGGAASAGLINREIDWWEAALPDLLPLLARRRDITIGNADVSGTMGCFYINHLHAPFNNPEIRRAVLGVIDQATLMTSVAGTDPSRWNGRVGIFCPNTPFATEAGMEVLTGPRDIAAAKAAIRAAGYNGEKVVVLQPADLASLSAMAEVMGQLLRELGMNVDIQTADWATVLQRRTRREPIEQGGWTLSPNSAPGLQTLDPAVHFWIRGNGLQAPVGWCDSPTLEGLRDQWLASADADQQKRLATEIQTQCWKDVPYFPAGQFFQKSAWRGNVTRTVNEMAVFWGVTKRD
jgi:peptide/nickel transport system substrate-binding protein